MHNLNQFIHIIRHKKENKKKCSLQPLIGRANFYFYSYPLPEPLTVIDDCTILTLDAPLLTEEDRERPLLLIDGTWRYAEKMERVLLSQKNPIRRSLPLGVKTAYPRYQTDCPNEAEGLASIEALYIAMRILQWDISGILDNYYWAKSFLEKNKSYLALIP